MTTLWEQKRTLVDENAKLVLQWLATLDDHDKHFLMCNMLKRYTLPDLRTMNAHLTARLAAAHEAGR